MTKKDLLPGVIPGAVAPSVNVDSRRAVGRARWRATARDLTHLILLAGVDYIFLHWSSTRVPHFDRHQTVLIMAGLNAAVLTHIALSRLFPRWSAKRIAATWSLSERARFFQFRRR